VEEPAGARGTEVLVFSAPCHPMWRTAQGLELFGPRHFGIDEDPVLVPLSDYPMGHHE
jgi:DUF917 family protein